MKVTDEPCCTIVALAGCVMLTLPAELAGTHPVTVQLPAALSVMLENELQTVPHNCGLIVIVFVPAPQMNDQLPAADSLALV